MLYKAVFTTKNRNWVLQLKTYSLSKIEVHTTNSCLKDWYRRAWILTFSGKELAINILQKNKKDLYVTVSFQSWEKKIKFFSLISRRICLKGAADREFELSSRISFTLQRLYNEHIFFVPLQATAESKESNWFSLFIFSKTIY